MNTPEAANSLQVSILDRLSKGEETAAAFKRYLHAPAHQKAMEDLEKAVIDANTLLTLIQHLVMGKDGGGAEWSSLTCAQIATHLNDYGVRPTAVRS